MRHGDPPSTDPPSEQQPRDPMGGASLDYDFYER